jgi:hypothetical protein
LIVYHFFGYDMIWYQKKNDIADLCSENAFSPLSARTKASNADMTVCLPLQDCIVQTTRLPAYGRKFLTPRCSPANKATGLRPDNFAPLHGSCPAALAGSQTACMRTLLPCCSGSFSNCIQALCSHLQWQVECPFIEKFIEFIEKYFYRIFRKKGLWFYDKFDKNNIFIRVTFSKHLRYRFCSQFLRQHSALSWSWNCRQNWSNKTKNPSSPYPRALY